MGRIGGGELLIIALIALLIFGASRISDIGKGLGEGIKNFKKGLKDEPEDGPPSSSRSRRTKAARRRSRPARGRVVSTACRKWHGSVSKIGGVFRWFGGTKKERSCVGSGIAELSWVR